MDAIIGDPDSNRLKCDNRSDREANQYKSFSRAKLFRRILHVSCNFLWKSTPGQAVSEQRGITGLRKMPRPFARGAPETRLHKASACDRLSFVSHNSAP